MRPASTRITFGVVLGAVLAVSLMVILRLSNRLVECQRQHSADAEALRTLQDTLRRRGLPVPLPETGENATVEHGAIAQREAIIARLDHDLAESRANLVDLQTKLDAANDQIAKLQSGSDERLQKQQADSQAQIDDLQKKLDAAQSAADIARQRSAALETDNSQLRSDSTTMSARATDVAHIIANLQDLERRREGYLTNILRRYRDIGDEFHAMGAMLDSSHDGAMNACGGAALSRIESAVSSAEDDMRQVSELNARTQKLEKQLSKN
jgi:predicted  nucleic acid-binding Zn-ribbon protein